MIIPRRHFCPLLLKVACDSSQDSDIAAAISRVREESGRLDILVIYLLKKGLGEALKKVQEAESRGVRRMNG